MKRKIENWNVDKLYRNRALISFPEYQRQPNLWSDDKKALLIDSILSDIDIPKLYFNKTSKGMYEVVDGQQRLWAVWDFLDDKYALRSMVTGKRFSQLTEAQQKRIYRYEFQVTELEDAEDEYLRELFIRLQLGLLLLAGEKLHAAVGSMKDLVFEKLSRTDFVQGLGIPARRFAKETLCAQLAINSFSVAKNGAFARTRYEDLEAFFKEYSDPRGNDQALFRSRSKFIAETLSEIGQLVGARVGQLRNRSYVLSVYLYFEMLVAEGAPATKKKKFVDFAFQFWRRLKEEDSAGFDRANRELYGFENLISSAPGEKYQIERRHSKLGEFFQHYQSTGKILGD